ncbi:MAG: hypothetical protein QOC82_2698 [Frankiaceae bacterium]|jgi:hypothetical protein|nr:hypothetical protein [Frankiaceae bacterium]
MPFTFGATSIHHERGGATRSDVAREVDRGGIALPVKVFLVAASPASRSGFARRGTDLNDQPR